MSELRFSCAHRSGESSVRLCAKEAAVPAAPQELHERALEALKADSELLHLPLPEPGPNSPQAAVQRRAAEAIALPGRWIIERFFVRLWKESLPQTKLTKPVSLPGVAEGAAVQEKYAETPAAATVPQASPQLSVTSAPEREPSRMHEECEE